MEATQADAPDPWFNAIDSNNVPRVCELLKDHQGSTSAQGETGLMRAARLGHLEIARLLAEKEAGTVTSAGHSALSLAAIANNAALCKLLAPLEAKKGIAWTRGVNPLIMAARNGAVSAVRILVKHFDVLHKDIDGMNALDHAVQRNFSQCVTALLETNNFTVGEIETSLLYSSAGEYANTLRLLTNAMRLKYNRSPAGKELSDLVEKNLENAALIVQLQAENKALRASITWMHAHDVDDQDKARDASTPRAAGTNNDAIHRLKQHLLHLDAKVRSLTTQLEQARSDLLVVTHASDTDMCELNMEAVRLKEAELRTLQTRLARDGASNTAALGNSDLLDVIPDCYLEESTGRHRSNAQRSCTEESASDTSPSESRTLTTPKQLQWETLQAESNSLIEFLDDFCEKADKRRNSPGKAISSLRNLSRHERSSSTLHPCEPTARLDEHSNPITQSRIMDDSNVEILQQEVTNLRSIVEKYESDKFAKSFAHEPGAFNLFSSSMLYDPRSSQLFDSLRRTMSPNSSNKRNQSTRPSTNPLRHRLSINVTPGSNYDPKNTENLITDVIESMESSFFTDSLTKEHASVSAAALKSKIEHLKEKMQNVKRPPKQSAPVEKSADTDISKAVQTNPMPILTAAHTAIAAGDNSMLTDFIALDKYKQASYEKTMSNMESYLIAVELKMKHVLRLAQHIFGHSESSMTESQSTIHDDMDPATVFNDGQLEGDVLQHIAALQKMLQLEKSRISSITNASSPHLKSGEASLLAESPIERPHRDSSFHHNRAPIPGNQSETRLPPAIPKAPSASNIVEQEDSHSDELGDEIVPSFEAFSEAQSHGTSHSDHTPASATIDLLTTELKEKATEIDRLKQKIADQEAHVRHLQAKENDQSSKIEERIRSLHSELQKQTADNAALKTRLATAGASSALLEKAENKNLAYKYLIHLLAQNPQAASDALQTFNRQLDAEAMPNRVVQELKTLLNPANVSKPQTCSNEAKRVLHTLLKVLPQQQQQPQCAPNTDTPVLKCEIITQDLPEEPLGSQNIPNPAHSVIVASPEASIRKTHEGYFRYNPDGNTPLMNAVLAEDLKAVRSLLHYSRQINKKGETALMLAVQTRNKDIILTLLSLEAGHVCANGDCALLRCLNLGELDLAGFLTSAEGIEPTDILLARENAGDKLPDMLNAAADGDMIRVWSLMRYQSRMTDATGKTALMIAAETGNLPIAKLLCSAECKMSDSAGRTALMFASINDNVDIATLLIPHEAGMQTREGKTALMYAASNNNISCVRMLIQHEKRKTAFGTDNSNPGYTALMVAANKARIDAIRLLLPHEGDMRDGKGRTAKDYAKDPAIKAEFTSLASH